MSITSTLKQLDHRYLWHPFTQMTEWCAEDPLIIERAEGNYLIDTEGRRYLDGISSLWVNIHGHRHPEMDRAISDQLNKVAHTTFLGLTHPLAIELAKRLIEIAPQGLSRVFFSDNGSTAVEVALKMAYQYWQQREKPRKQKFLSFREAYHGDTIGSVSVGGIEIFHQIFHPLLFSTLKADTSSIETCVQQIKDHADELAAVVVEPLVQGAAGMLLMPKRLLKATEKACRENKVLLIVDEVATGFGRTGKMFACEHEQIQPDLMAVAKGITGGYLPLAATLATEEIYSAFLGQPEEFKAFFHGHSYTANPLACAAALASLDIFKKEKVLEKLSAKIAYLQKSLERFWNLEHVGDIRQKGMMVGIELMQDKNTRKPYEYKERIGHRVCMKVRSKGVILRPLGNVIVWMPPLSIILEEIDLLTKATYEAIREITG
jgi:adenosylmethionine-8-amino-7-oxononanoate aminotransferase